MPGALRHHVAEGIAGVIRAVPDEATIVVQIRDLDRATFDHLRAGAEVTYLERCEIWSSMVNLGAGCFLELETDKGHALRSVG